MVIVVFWICLLLVLYVYCGYPLLLFSGLLGRVQPIDRHPMTPTVSIIVPAYNEESSIGEKLANLLMLDYPKACIEILVGSDGSSDRTVEIANRLAFNNPIIRVLANPEQRGKSMLQNDLVALSKGEVLVFTDADCFLDSASLHHLVENFSDPDVGLVTSRPRYVNEMKTNVTRNEGIYLRYESWIRAQESQRGLLAMASGSLFGIRRVHWRPLDANQGDDFVLPLGVALDCKRTILDDRCIVTTLLTQDDPRSMLRMKSRIISKDLRGLIGHAAILNPVRYGTISVALLSHKLLRWFLPYLLPVLLFTSLLLANRPFFAVVTFVQVILYAMAILGILLNPVSWGLWSVPSSFCLVNTASVLGTLHYFSGRTSGRWKTVR